MSETERAAGVTPLSFTPSRDEDFDESLFERAAAIAEPAATEGREGLPPTFRMRHDAHYVEQITARASVAPVHMIAVKSIDGAHPLGAHDLGPLVKSISEFGVLQPLLVRRRNGRYELIAGSKRLAAAMAAGLSEVPCLLQAADDARARALAEADNLRCDAQVRERPLVQSSEDAQQSALGELLDSLATLESCLNLFIDRERPLRERVALELMRAEANRASWLAHVSVLLEAAPSVTFRPVSPARLVERSVQGLEAEGRLSGVDITVQVDEPTRTLSGDARLLALALTGAIGAMLAMLRELGGGTLRVGAGWNPATRLFMFQVAQDRIPSAHTRMATSGESVLSDSTVEHRPSIGLAVARRVAELHGGRLDLTAAPHGGCTVRIVLPDRVE